MKIRPGTSHRPHVDTELAVVSSAPLCPTSQDGIHVQDRPSFPPIQRHRRGGFALVRSLLEVLVTWLVIWGAVFIIPILLETTIRSPSVSEVSRGEPIFKLAVAAEGKEVWFQLGRSELVSMDLATRSTTPIYKKEGRPIGYWNVSQDGKTYLVWLNEHEIRIVRNQEIIAWEQVVEGASLMTALSSNGKTAVRICAGTSAKAWDLSQDEPVESEFTLPVPAVKIAFDSTGGRLAIQSSREGLLLCDSKTGTVTGKLAEYTSVSQEPLFSEDGNWLVVSYGRSIAVYDLRSGAMGWTIQTLMPDAFVNVAFSPDGKSIATSSIFNGIQIFDMANGQRQRQLPLPSSIHRIVYSRSGDALYSGGTDGSINIWSLATGRKTEILKLLEEPR